MNKIVKIACCSLFATMFIICESCKETPSPKPNVVILDLNSGEGIIKSIEIICVPGVWTQERFDSINTAINSLAAAGRLKRSINEDEKHLANLFTSSASCLERKVDSIFRLPVYKGYDQMRKDLDFLKEYLALYLEAGVDIDSINPSLAKVTDIFNEYDRRLRMSRYTFSQTPRYLVAYSQNYTSTANSIKENNKPQEYWSNYFSHNTEIVNGVNAFPDRLSKSRTAYYAALEKVIERKAVEEKFSPDEIKAVERKFYNMANGYNQTAINQLGIFRENYIHTYNANNQ